MRTSTVVATIIGSTAVLGLAAWAGAGQRLKTAVLPPAQPATTKQVGDWVKTFVFMIRGSEGLDIPAALQKRAQEISDSIARRADAKKFPVITQDDINTLTFIAKAKAA